MKNCRFCELPRVRGRALCFQHYREYMRQKGKESYARHKATRVKECQEYRDANPKQRAISLKKYYLLHKAEQLQRTRKYKHARRTTQGQYTDEQLQARFAFYGWRCYLCGCDLLALPQREQTIEHVIPISRGGTNWPANFRPACLSCNARKGNKEITIKRVMCNA